MLLTLPNFLLLNDMFYLTDVRKTVSLPDILQIYFRYISDIFQDIFLDADLCSDGLFAELVGKA